jgi:hypothetical protein
MADALVSYAPRDANELTAYCQRITKTGMVPPAFRGKPEEAFVAISWGHEVAGLPPLTALQYVAIINGRPGFFSDAVPGIALMKGHIKDLDVEWTGKEMTDEWTATCTVIKANGKPLSRSFSVLDAKVAGLWGKSGPWSSFPRRMLGWRAIGYAVRDAAPHALFGLSAEELRDSPEQEHVGPDKARDVTPTDYALGARMVDEAVVELARERPQFKSIEEANAVILARQHDAFADGEPDAETGELPNPPSRARTFDVLDEHGNSWSRCVTASEALASYGKARLAAKDPVEVDIQNLILLRELASKATNGAKTKLEARIADAEAKLYAEASDEPALPPADLPPVEGAHPDEWRPA